MSFKDLVSTHEYKYELAKLDFALETSAAMRREGVNNAALAELLGVSRPMVSKLLRGDANVTIETMVKVAEALKGSLFLKIVRNGCSARFLEVAEAAKQKAQDSMIQAPEYWHVLAAATPEKNAIWNAANESVDETESVAA